MHTKQPTGRSKSSIETDDMGQVPLVLQPAQDGSYTVIGIFTKNGKKQMDGVLVGDKLIKVGDLANKTATFGAVIEALHGWPGATRTLLIERDGKQFTVTGRVLRAKAGLQGKHMRPD
jgi:C-terminal processing protease CtpA/Prc